MTLLPDTDRILLGPGPSLTAPRVMRAMASPTVSHLDPIMTALLDDIRARLGATVPRARGIVGVGGLGHRNVRHGNRRRESGASPALACSSSSPATSAIDSRRCVERTAPPSRGWTSSGDAPAIPTALRRALAQSPADIVGTGARGNIDGCPQSDRRARGDCARARCAGPRRRGDLAWRASAGCRRLGNRRVLQLHAEMSRRAVRSGAGRLHSARAGAACAMPQLLSRSAAARRLSGCGASITTRCRRRSCTRSTRRWRLSKRKGSRRDGRDTSAITRLFLDGLEELGLSVLPPRRRAALDAQRGARSGRRRRGGRAQASAGGIQHRDRRRPRAAGRKNLARRPDGRQLRAAADRAAARRAGERACPARRSNPRVRSLVRGSGRSLGGIAAVGIWRVPCTAISRCRTSGRSRTRIRRRRRSSSCAPRRREPQGKAPRSVQRWVGYRRISPHLKRAVLVAEDAAFWQHEGVDYDELQKSIELDWARGQLLRGASTITQQLAKNLYLVAVAESGRASCANWSSRGVSRRSSEGADSRAVSQRDRVGRRHLRRRGRVASLLRQSASALGADASALLAGAIINPRVLNPAQPTPRLLRRQQIILKRMGARHAAGGARSKPARSPSQTQPVSAPRSSSRYSCRRRFRRLSATAEERRLSHNSAF